MADEAYDTLGYAAKIPNLQTPHLHLRAVPPVQSVVAFFGPIDHLSSSPADHLPLLALSESGPYKFA